MSKDASSSKVLNLKMQAASLRKPVLLKHWAAKAV